MKLAAFFLLLATLVAPASAQRIPAQLAKQLKSSKFPDRLQALKKLEKIPGAKAAALMLEVAVKDRELMIRDQAIHSLQNRKKDPDTIFYLGKMVVSKVNSKKNLFQLAALKSLGNMAQGVAPVVKTIASALDHRDPRVRQLTAFAIGRSRAKTGFKPLCKRLQHEKDPRTRGFIADALSFCGKKDAGPLLATICMEPDPLTAVPALRALRYADRNRAGAVANTLAAEKYPRRLRLQVVENCGWLKRRDSIPPLLTILGSSSGRLQKNAREALVTITGKKYGMDIRSWRRWWNEEGQDFDPRAKTKKQPKDRHQSTRGWGYYHGHEVTSNRIVLLVDGSGSMRQPMGTSGRSRYSHASKELNELVAKMPVDTLFNIIFFSTKPIAWQDQLVPASTKNKKEAKTFLRRFSPSGLTNMLDSLVTAMRMEDVGTIYILSDGAPSAGEHRFRRLLLQKVKRENLFAKVVIHTINFGGSKRNQTLLKQLAKGNGGESR